MDWNDIHSPISKHFIVKDALWLPKWNRAATVADNLTDEYRSNLVTLFSKMDIVRDFIGLPIVSIVSFRPTQYNTLIHGATNSAHLYGMALDFYVQGHTGVSGCDKIRKLIVPMLEAWDMRCENISGDWIHMDTREPEPGGRRFFVP